MDADAPAPLSVLIVTQVGVPVKEIFLIFPKKSKTGKNGLLARKFIHRFDRRLLTSMP